jgi:hypothetical protein
MVPLELRICEILIKPSAVDAMGATIDNGRSVNRSSICQVEGEVGVALWLRGTRNMIIKNPKGSKIAPINANLEIFRSGEVSAGGVDVFMIRL